MKYSHPAALMALAVGGSLCSISPTIAAGNVTLSLDQSALYGGGTAKGTVTLSQAAPAGGISVTLVSANPALVGVPATVSVPGGKKTATFTVTTQPVSAYASVSITATYSGRSQVAKIALAPPAVRWLKFAPYTFSGGSRTTGTIYLSSPAPQGGTRVQVSVDNAAFATVPDSVVVPAGSVTANFSVTASASPTRRYATISAGPGRFGGPVTGVLTILASAMPAPAAPIGLTATGQWDSDCAPCDNMSMPEIALSWQAVPGAISYTVLRDGTPLQAGITETNCDDMTVESGKTYSYTVKAVNASGESAPCAPTSATAPTPLPPPAANTLLAPVNLSVTPFWDATLGKGSDNLSWFPVAGAISYNVYRYDVQIGTGISASHFTVAPNQFVSGETYTVTAVDGAGNESIPSACAQVLDAFDPNHIPSWAGPWVPTVPNTLTVTPESNAGQTRNKLEWRSDSLSIAYNIYRDGVILAKNITGQVYIDVVNSGENHTYAITGVNTAWPATVESAQSAPVQTAAMTANAVSARRTLMLRGAKHAFPKVAPHGHHKKGPLKPKTMSAKASPKDSVAVLPIVRVVPNDDSAVVVLPELPAGAADYRVYDVSNPNKVKYAGVRTTQTRVGQPSTEPYAIEWNGIDPSKGANLVVEAVDKLGPFQKMDGAMGPGSMTMDGAMVMNTNGQGDPSNVPNVVARSASFHVDCTPRTLTGTQAFFDNFRNEQPLKPVTNIAPPPAGFPVEFYGSPTDYAEFENDKWVVRDHGGDLTHSKVFFMGNHLMDTLYDGGGPGSPNPGHNNNASITFMPKQIADISGGKTLHVTFEVDAHLGARRFLYLALTDASEILYNPGKNTLNGLGENSPLPSGNALLYQINSSTPGVNLLVGGVRYGLVHDPEGAWQSFNRGHWDGVTPLCNGTTQDLDKRHKFDLYLSKNRVRFEEWDARGNLVSSQDNPFPAGVELPFDKIRLFFAHDVYHTGNDRPELMSNAPWEKYWINHRPWADERHWDNMGFEVLDSFPSS